MSLKAVRVQISQAEAQIAQACVILRRNGFPESADDLSRQLKALRVWTQPNGWLHWLERGDDED